MRLIVRHNKGWETVIVVCGTVYPNNSIIGRSLNQLEIIDIDNSVFWFVMAWCIMLAAIVGHGR